MNHLLRVTIITLLLAVSNLYADWWYVAPGSTYSNIQQAADVALPDDVIFVDWAVEGSCGGLQVGEI